MHMLRDALIFLAATVVAVPFFKRLGLGAVLGYLTAGAVIGPFGLKAIGEVESVLEISELGVVLLLFLIGLELEPSRLWKLRRSVFGLGSLQVAGTAALLAAAGLLFGLPWQAAVIAGLGLSLSSTAFALQLLGEKGELTTPYGQASFAILLFQDLAVIPMLAVLPMLGEAAPTDAPRAAAWLTALKVAGVIAAIAVPGRFVVRRVFRVVAATESQELFTATALLVALGTAALVNAVGMSMALGAFLAGVLLANSEYRHELEADIEPFKGLLLGLFFIAVGMSANLGLLLHRPFLVAALVTGLVVLKAAFLFAIGRWKLREVEQASSLAVVISQGGEFAFVLFNLAVGHQVLERGVSELLVVVVTLSMATTPLLFMAYERALRPRLRARAHGRREFDVSPTEDTPVIIAGFGRVGQVVGRLLTAKRIPFTALDSSAEHIDFLKRFGNKTFYGDASRLELLRAARSEHARVFVIAIDDVEASLRTAESVLKHFPRLTIVARARNRQHAYRLMKLGVTRLFRETFAASLDLSAEVLESLGYAHDEVRTAVERFREHDERMLLTAYQHAGDEKKLIELAMRARAELESLFDQDKLVGPQSPLDGVN
jgi:glutathione-regulated potassium-efflux system ancillary protein KefC